MLLFNCGCEINLTLTWSTICFIVDASVENQVLKFTINDTKIHVAFVTLSTQEHEKPLQSLKSFFYRKINCNKYKSKVTDITGTKPIFRLLNWSKFLRINKLFASYWPSKLQEILSFTSKRI